jgi:hypothetical protein
MKKKKIELLSPAARATAVKIERGLAKLKRDEQAWVCLKCGRVAHGTAHICAENRGF